MENTQSEPIKTKASGRGLPIWAIVLAFAVLGGFLLFLGLGVKRSQDGPILIGQTVPPIYLTTFDGQAIKTTDLKGKVIVLNFWASWCLPCAGEAADLQEAWNHYEPGGKVVFMGVDYVDTEPEARGYLAKYNITYSNGPDMRTVISQTFHIQGVPETYFIDQEGHLAYAQIGPFSSFQEITNVIDPLLK